MTATTLSSIRPTAKASFDIGPATRSVVAMAAGTLTLLSVMAIARGVLGYAPDHPNIRELAIFIHVATVLPAIPLGGYLLLGRKGGTRHKRLGKLWLTLMMTTATSAIFIQTSGSFSFIHVFIPLTYIAAVRVITSARRGDMKTHKGQILNLYLGALMIPGIVAFALPGRLMHVWLFA